MDSAIATVKNALRERRDTLVAALRRELPEAEFSPPQGGYFMWVVLPEEVSVAELEKAAAERGVIFVKGTDFLLEGGENTLRLAYSGVTPDADRRGRLAARGGRPIAWRHCIATGTIRPRSASCTATRDRVAVLIHGGFWRQRYGRELEGGIARDLVARGWAVWNIEYRRLGGGGGWPETFDDVEAAIGALPVEASRVVAIGHSAGGQLAVWARGAGRSWTRAVSQAGALDLDELSRLGTSDGVVNQLLGGHAGRGAAPLRAGVAAAAAADRRPAAARARRARRRRARPHLARVRAPPRPRRATTASWS